MGYAIGDAIRFEVLDCGDTQGARYQVDAITSDGDRVATEHIASCFDEDRTELIADALRFYKHMQDTLAFKQWRRKG